MNLDAWEAALDDYVAEVSRNTGEQSRHRSSRPARTHFRLPTDSSPRTSFDSSPARSATRPALALLRICANDDVARDDRPTGLRVMRRELPSHAEPAARPRLECLQRRKPAQVLQADAPRDEIRAEDTWLGIVEKAKLDRPYRLFLLTAERAYINQQNEVVCTMLGRMICTATPPGSQGRIGGSVHRSQTCPVQQGRARRAARGYEDELSEAIPPRFRTAVLGGCERGRGDPLRGQGSVRRHGRGLVLRRRRL